MAEKVSEISLIIPLEPDYILPQVQNIINLFAWISFMDLLTSIVIKKKKSEIITMKISNAHNSTVRMISTAHFSVHILFLHYYKSNLAHLSDLDSLVIRISKSER